MPNTDLNPQNGLQGSSYLYDAGTSANTRTAVSQKVRLLAPAYGDSAPGLTQLAVLSEFGPSQSKSVEAIRGIGFGDKIAELVPSVTEPYTASFSRALLYLSNLWQSTGYAAGVDGPVRSLAHHRWPFDVEEQLVFSSLADADLGVANAGQSGAARGFGDGVKAVRFPASQTPTDPATRYPSPQGHSAIITLYEAGWFTSWNKTVSADSGQIMESGEATFTDVHDFSSTYGEFLASGNDVTVNQRGSLRYP